MELEIRTLPASEIRADDEGMIRASIQFDTLSVPLGGFREKIAPTAFDGAINDESREVLAFWNHDSSKPLGRRSAGTLRVSRTDAQFIAEIDAGETSWAQDALRAIRRRDVDGMSFGFRVQQNGDIWEEDADGNLVRTLTKVDLIEVSPTPIPAYPASSASARAFDLSEIRSALNAAETLIGARSVPTEQVREMLASQEQRRRVEFEVLADALRRNRLPMSAF